MSTHRTVDEIQQHLSHPGPRKSGEQLQAPVDSSNHLGFGDRLRFLPTGVTRLDKHLKGGIRLGTVTEIVGEAGIGKTQLGLQLCVLAARYNQGAVYVDTENKLPVPRLREIGQEWRKRHLGLSNFSSERYPQDGSGLGFNYNQHGTCLSLGTPHGLTATQGSHLGFSDHSVGSFKRAEQLLDNLTVHKVSTTKDLLSRLSSLEDEILHRNEIASHDTGNEDGGKYPVRLLIVDSIAAPMRRDFGSDSAPQRAVAIFQCAQALKRLADHLNLAVVVVNQVGSSDLGESSRSARG
ncbi:MAG: hypothetical protein SGILL_009298, partial [Bacillariaceae sp.]